MVIGTHLYFYLVVDAAEDVEGSVVVPLAKVSSVVHVGTIKVC